MVRQVGETTGKDGEAAVSAADKVILEKIYKEEDDRQFGQKSRYEDSQILVGCCEAVLGKY